MNPQELIQKLEGLNLDPLLLGPIISRLRQEGVTEELRQMVVALIKEHLEVVQAEQELLTELEEIAADTQAGLDATEDAVNDELDQIEQETVAQMDAMAAQQPAVAAPLSAAPTAAVAPTAPAEPVPVVSPLVQAAPAVPQAAPAVAGDWASQVGGVPTAAPAPAAPSGQ